MAAASALSYVFVVILSRALGPADFGGFSSFNSIGLVLAIPAAAFQVLYAGRVARRGPAAFDLRLPLLVGAVGCLLTVALSPVLAHVTRVDSVLAPIVVGLGLPALILNGALMGGLLGMRRIGALSLGYVAIGVSRVRGGDDCRLAGPRPHRRAGPGHPRHLRHGRDPVVVLPRSGAPALVRATREPRVSSCGRCTGRTPRSVSSWP